MKEIIKSILDVEEGIVAHCCNSLGVMGGLAGKIAKKYPQVYETYISRKSSLYLGTNQLIGIDGKLCICNMITQSEIGTHKVQTNFTALRQCLTDLKEWGRVLETDIYLPYYLGSGLAGGPTKEIKANTWEKVKSLIEEIIPEAIICNNL